MAGLRRIASHGVALYVSFRDRFVRRYSDPVVIALTVALAVSLAIHLPIYGALGVLAKLFKDESAATAPEPVTVEFDVGEPSEADQGDRDEPTEEAEAAAEPQPAVEEPPRRRQRVAEREEAEEPEEPEEEAEEEEPAAVAEAQPAPPPEDHANLQAVQQRSQNPEEAPDNPQYIAEENNRVEEETVAELRNYQRDDVEQSAGREQEPVGEELGNANEDEIADAREMEGSDQRSPTEEEARAERPRQAPDRPLPSVAARGDTAREGAADTAEGATDAREGGDRGGATASGGGETRQRMVTVSDGMGTFRIAVPDEPEGAGPGAGGGEARPGTGRGDQGSGERAGRAGAGRRGDRGRGRGTGRRGPDLRVSWSQFEEVYTEEELREEREAWVEERRSRLRGSNREESWREFRAAIENFAPNVRPGNQTALNAAASPFANYLAHVHRRIHREFADGFLRGLPAGGTSPFADRTLNTKLEIILNRDGTVHRIGVVKTSGFLPFDHGAFASVMRGQPYPEAPSQIVSGDGRVYFHWGFYRNERQCGTFNAEPYILPNPPGTPDGAGGPLRDRGVVPRGARPTWGTQPGGGGGAGEREPGGSGEDDGPAPEGEFPDDGEPRRRDPDVPAGGVMG